MTVKNIDPLPDNVIVRDLEFGEKVTKGGIILLDDDGKEEGIHPRWAEVWRVGSNITNIKEGQWVLVDHGRWSRSIVVETEDDESFKVNRIDYPEAVLLVGDRKPDS